MVLKLFIEKPKRMPQKRNYQIKTVPDEIHQKLTYIGQLIKQTRLSYGMTQIDFAKQQGISKNSLQNLEYGKNVTLLSLLTTINEIYSICEFFEDIESFILPVSKKPLHF